MADTQSTESTEVHTGTESQRAAEASTASTESTEQTTQHTADTKQTPTDDEVAKLRKQLEDAEARQRDAIRESRKRKDKLTEERKAASNYQALYEETDQELSSVRTEIEQLRPQIEAKDAEIAALRKENEGYRKGIVDRFEEADKEYAKTLPLDQLPQLFERLYGKSMLAPPPQAKPSLGGGNVQTNSVSAQSRLDAAAVAGDKAAINAAMDEMLGKK